MIRFKDENKNIIEQREAAMLLAEDIMSLLDSNFTFYEVRPLAEKRAAELKHLLSADLFASIGKKVESSATCKHCLQVAAVPHEMSAVEYLRAYDRMHNSVCSCAECPLSHYHNGTGYSCYDYIGTHPAEAVTIVEKWAKEHPEEVKDEID